METYKVVLKNGVVWRTTFTTIDDLKEYFKISTEEWETQNFKEIKEVKIYDNKGRYFTTQKELMMCGKKIKDTINPIIEDVKQCINTFVNVLNEHKYLLYIQTQLIQNKVQYEELKTKGKVKGIGIKIPLGVAGVDEFNTNYKLDDDGIYIDYLIKMLNQYGFDVEEHPPLMFVPYGGRCIISKGISVDEYFWVGMDCNIKPNHYGFDIHNHLNPNTHTTNDINPSFELIEDLNNKVKGGLLYTNKKRFNLGTTIIIMSMLKDNLTQKEMEMLMLSDGSFNYKNTLLDKLSWYKRLKLMEVKTLSDEFKGERVKHTSVKNIMESPNHKWINVDDTFVPIHNFKILHNPTFTKGKLIGEHYFSYEEKVKVYTHYMEWDF